MYKGREMYAASRMTNIPKNLPVFLPRARFIFPLLLFPFIRVRQCKWQGETVGWWKSRQNFQVVKGGKGIVAAGMNGAPRPSLSSGFHRGFLYGISLLFRSAWRRNALRVSPNGQNKKWRDFPLQNNVPVEICFENMRSCRNILSLMHLNHNEIRGDGLGWLIPPRETFRVSSLRSVTSLRLSSVRGRVQRPRMSEGGKSGDVTCDEAIREKVILLLRARRISDKRKGRKAFPRFSRQICFSSALKWHSTLRKYF